MRKLDRSSVPFPSCLVEPPNKYSKLSGGEKTEIRSTLLLLQGQKCAYCERRTGNDIDDGHIEHFRSQSDHSSLDCSWDNLFWSCNDEKTCGKHKDKCVRFGGPKRKFDPSHIINPSIDDPELFMLFVSDGTIRAITELSEDDQYRVTETLRVFQLEAPSLRKAREDAVKPYIKFIDTLVKANPELVSIYIQSELSDLPNKPFSAAINAFLRSVE
jgi:uncharacterized protein (TIGR02646 family)